MKYKSVLLLLIGIASLSTFKLPVENILSFKTSSGHTIKVFKGQIFYDNKVIFKRKYEPKGYIATRSSKTASWGWNKLKNKN